jgi:putative oxidoreductase
MNDFALLILRLVAGGYIVKYGLPKLRDVDGSFAKEFESLGFHPAATFVKRAGRVEALSGTLIALGFLGPAGPMLLLSDMVVAAVGTTARAKRFDLDQHEEEALFAAIALVLALGGPGEFSVDSAFDIRIFDRAWLRGLSVPAALAGALFMLSQRRPPPPTES